MAQCEVRKTLTTTSAFAWPNDIRTTARSAALDARIETADTVGLRGRRVPRVVHVAGAGPSRLVGQSEPLRRFRTHLDLQTLPVTVIGSSSTTITYRGDHSSPTSDRLCPGRVVQQHHLHRHRQPLGWLSGSDLPGRLNGHSCTHVLWVTMGPWRCLSTLNRHLTGPVRSSRFVVIHIAIEVFAVVSTQIVANAPVGPHLCTQGVHRPPACLPQPSRSCPHTLWTTADSGLPDTPQRRVGSALGCPVGHLVKVLDICAGCVSGGG